MYIYCSISADTIEDPVLRHMLSNVTSQKQAALEEQKRVLEHWSLDGPAAAAEEAPSNAKDVPKSRIVRAVVASCMYITIVAATCNVRLM